MPKDKDKQKLEQSELSDTWLELLGDSYSSQKSVQPAASEEAVPILATDPWSALSQDEDIEVVDLQTLHLRVSDQDVENMMEIMQEQASTQVSEKPGRIKKRPS